MAHANTPWGPLVAGGNLCPCYSCGRVVPRRALWTIVPGLNGDEAWQGVQAQRLVARRADHVANANGQSAQSAHISAAAGVARLVWPPSVTLLRLTPLASGLAALVVNYLFCRRVFDRQLATISTVILAVLPAMVAYSRFAWDASQSVLVTLPVMYCTGSDSPAGTPPRLDAGRGGAVPGGHRPSDQCISSRDGRDRGLVWRLS